MKKRYIVTFYKGVADDQGHESEVLQHQVEVFAASERAALQQAQAGFCRRHGLADWSQHADRYQVDQPDFPS
jgi:1,2-phenylacetyl-CoA epoxidase PaaB subunit